MRRPEGHLGSSLQTRPPRPPGYRPRGAPLFELDEVCFGYGGPNREGATGRLVLDTLSLEVEAGEYVALLGPNGAGKSTLLRLLAGTLTPLTGSLLLDGMPLRALSRRALAQRIAVLPQRLHLTFDATVEEMVSLGRIPHSSPLAALRGPSAHDRAAVEAALELTDTARFRGCAVQELSGGEQQRVALALALAQEPRVLLLDEPTSHLDPAHALSTLELVAHHRRERGLTVVAVFHDLNLASLFAKRLLVLHQGRLVASGPPAAVLRSQVLAPIFGACLSIVPHPVHHLPQALPVRVNGQE